MKKKSKRTTTGAGEGRSARARKPGLTSREWLEQVEHQLEGLLHSAASDSAGSEEERAACLAVRRQLNGAMDDLWPVTHGAQHTVEELERLAAGRGDRLERGDASNMRVFNRARRLDRDRVRLLNAAWDYVTGFKESLVELHQKLGKGGPRARELLEDRTFGLWVKQWRLGGEVTWVFSEVERFLRRDRPRRFPVVRVMQTDDRPGSVPRPLLPPEPVLRASQLATQEKQQAALESFHGEASKWNELAGLAGSGAEEPRKESRDLKWLALNRLGRMPSKKIADAENVPDGETVKKAIQRAASALELGRTEKPTSRGSERRR